MSTSCPLCGVDIGPEREAWLHFQEAHSGSPGPAAPRPRHDDRSPPGSDPSGPGHHRFGPGDDQLAPGVDPSADAFAQPPSAPTGRLPGGGRPGQGLWRQSYQAAPATMTIIVITIGVWLVHLALLRSGIDSDLTLGGNGTLGAHSQWWRLITPVVVHFGVVHILFNMLWLYQLGTAVERIMGRWSFVASYMATAVAGNVASDVYYFHQPHVLSGGASGAVYGLIGILTGAYGMARSIDRRHPGPPRPGSLSFNGEAVRSLAIVFGIFLVVGPLLMPVDVAAHVGGVVMGLIIGAVLCWSRNGPRPAATGTPIPSPGPDEFPT